MNSWRALRSLSFLSQKKQIELYPLFFLMRVKALELTNDWRHVRLRLPLNAITRNRGGFMFGGCQAALADPIAAIACAKNFPTYSVWTRTLELDFRTEGKTALELRFNFDTDYLNAISEELKLKGRSTPRFEYGFYLPDGALCTFISCSVAIRPKGYRSEKKISPTQANAKSLE